MTFLKKSALAVAVAASAASLQATAATFDFTLGNTEFPSAIQPTGQVHGTVVLANVIFGEGNPGVGSEETLINAPAVIFDLVDADLNTIGDVIDIAGETATVKYTLGGSAVFGEDLSTTALLDGSNGTNGAFEVTGSDNAGISYEVVQGGAIGDNTITIEITVDTNADTIETLTFGNFKVKNLKADLKKSAAAFPKVELGIEYVEEPTAVVADDLVSTATATPLVIFGSQDPLNLSGTANDDFTTAPFTRINVGSGETSFTNGADGRKDFDPVGDTVFVTLGTLQLQRQNIDFTANAYPEADVAGSDLVKKENGQDFDFQGGDKHRLVISAGSGSLQPGATVYLSDDACTAASNAVPNLLNTSAVVDGDGVATMAVSGNTTAITAPLNVCYTIDADEKIPEADQIAAEWTVDFFNTRYDNFVDTYEAYGPLKRNGCIASFFNLPGVGENDTAFIRLTNTSSTNEGPVIATLYAQDGTVLVEDKEISGTLVQHATQVYTTMGASSTNAYGQDLLSIAEALDIDGDAAEYKGRARLVLKGAFDTCEGLGMLKSGSTGALLNLTDRKSVV